jgi:hypothetical protein
VAKFDQFTMWRCSKCDAAGIDSWNKAMFDGVEHPAELPNPWVLGMECWACCWACVVSYGGPNDVPRAIYAPTREDGYAHEDAAFARFTADPETAGEPLRPSSSRSGDWSRGCLAAKGQLQ